MTGRDTAMGRAGKLRERPMGVIVIGKVDDATIMQARIRARATRHRVHEPDDCRSGAVLSQRSTREVSFELEQHPVGAL